MTANNMMINYQTMMMALRKGDTGTACLHLNENVDGCTFWFVVKENASQPDEEAPILQKFEHAGGPYLVINISEEESDRLSAAEDPTSKTSPVYKDYIWGVKYVENIRDFTGKITGVGRVKTLVPHCLKRPPIFRVYPEIIGGPHYDL